MNFDNGIFQILKVDTTIRHMLEYAENNGTFFKKTNDSYWYPSLNAGIPITNKPDPIHQAIYVLHDIVHCVLPDPLPSTSEATYILTKIAGEVYSNIIADGYAVHVLNQQNVQYDFSQRKVYPMFQAVINNGTGPQEAILLLSKYILEEMFVGTGLLKIVDYVQPQDAHTVYEYFTHYDYFFSTDIVWNARNYRSFFGPNIAFYAGIINRNTHLLKNEHYFYITDDPTEVSVIIDTFEKHIRALFAGELIPKGDGILLGNLLSTYAINGNLSVYEHISMKYGHIEKEEYKQILNQLRG
ncbi:hypothetical protein D3C78_19660 [compost metagenome]